MLLKLQLMNKNNTHNDNVDIDKINNLINDYLGNCDNIKIIFRKCCGYEFLNIFSKKITIPEIITHLKSISCDSNIQLFMNKIDISQNTGTLYDYIVSNNITSCKEYYQRGSFYYLEYYDSHVH